MTRCCSHERVYHSIDFYTRYNTTSRGMASNHEKCELLTINSSDPVYLTNFDQHPCQCDFCQTRPDPFLPKELKVEPTPHADYLGSALTYNSSATADVKKRYAQAAHAAKCLHDFVKHPSISVPRKLLVHFQIVLAILLCGSELPMYSHAHFTKLNKLHFKVLRQIFNIKSSFPKVLEPSAAECSNEYLAQLAYEYSRSFSHRPKKSFLPALSI